MKYRHIISICLCLFTGITEVGAQLYSTSSRDFHSFGAGAASYAPMSSGISSSMRSTSSFSTSTTISHYSTAPIQIANGTIQTAASTLKGGILADDTGFISTGSNQTNTTWNEEEDGWGPGTPDLPLHLDWDAFLLLLALTLLYAFRRYRKRQKA